MDVFRCRKCRYDLQIEDAVIFQYKDCHADRSTESGQSSVWYLDVEKAPEWIQLEITDASWTKGKLVCPKCNGRLGSFDFLIEKQCCCGNHAMSSVHLLKSRVDYFRKQDIPVVRTSGQARTSNVELWRQTQLALSENNTTLDFSNNNSSTQFDHTWSFMSNIDCEHMDSEIGAASNLPWNGKKSSQDKEEKSDSLNDHSSPVSRVKMKTSLSNESMAFPGHSEYFEKNSRKSGVRKRSQKCVKNSEYMMQSGNMDRQNNRRLLYDGDNVNNTFKGSEDEQVVQDNKFEVLSEPLMQDSMTQSESQEDIEEEVEIPSELSCPICLELYYQPHVCCPCQHVFCEHCLRDVCKQKPINTPCPLCRKLIDSCQPCHEKIARIKQELPVPYNDRKKELQKLKKTTKFYPLPQATSHHVPMSARLRQLEEHYSRQGIFFGLEDSLTQCIQDVVIRLAWVILLFLIHNVMFFACNRLNIQLYIDNTFHFNDFLSKMCMKLLNFGFLHTVRRCLGLTFDRRDILGYIVVYAALCLIFYLEAGSWIQFGYNMVILGSLFTN